MFILGLISGALMMTVVIWYLKSAVNAVYETFTKGDEAFDDPLTWTAGIIIICTFTLWGCLMFFVQGSGWYENPTEDISLVIISMAMSWGISQLAINGIVRLWVKCEKPEAKFRHIIGLKLKST
jgi:hypothetical protein